MCVFEFRISYSALLLTVTISAFSLVVLFIIITCHDLLNIDWTNKHQNKKSRIVTTLPVESYLTDPVPFFTSITHVPTLSPRSTLIQYTAFIFFTSSAPFCWHKQLTSINQSMVRHSMQHSVKIFSRALATIEFIMVRCRLLSIAELSLSCSDLAWCIFEMCTWYCILFLLFF